MSENYCVYLVKCQDSRGKISYYCGYTKDPQRRYKEHKRGSASCRHTKMREVLGMRILFSFFSRGDAMFAEQYIKENYSPKEKEQCYESSEINEVRLESIEI